ncbi:MAG TPA: phosphatidylserine decarboxylase family protein [Saprospiraceae bacterium]|nr:phosphatidylserine decarboxylase family protein [Saprospiraceae bacterium]
MYIHKEGIIWVAGTLAGYLVLCFVFQNYFRSFFWPAMVLYGIFFILVLNFFRNPVRTIPERNDQLVYAAADGKIVVIERVEEPEYFKDSRLMVSIFMNPLDVHCNRYPVSGKVLYAKYHPGEYLVAWHPKASTLNERSTVVVETPQGTPVLIRQIAGALARRICLYAQAGQSAQQGEDLGFIKFGSRVDLYLPLDAKVQVQIGQKVKGNLDVIAKI